jgi:hypothetical protein
MEGGWNWLRVVSSGGGGGFGINGVEQSGSATRESVGYMQSDIKLFHFYVVCIGTRLVPKSQQLSVFRLVYSALLRVGICLQRP